MSDTKNTAAINAHAIGLTTTPMSGAYCANFALRSTISSICSSVNLASVAGLLSQLPRKAIARSAMVALRGVLKV